MSRWPPLLSRIPTPLSPVSDMEAKCYYAGLPSWPVLIARTGTTPWKAPDPMGGLEHKELGAVWNHEINSVWEDDLALKVHTVLHAKKVDWSSTDVVRIGYVKEPPGDVALWIGVMPGSLSYEVGIDVALQCKRDMLDYGIHDVEVEIRESVVTQSAGPKLFEPAHDTDPMVDVLEPFAATLGIPICAQSTPLDDSKGGFFLDEGGDGKRLLLVTARHVVFPQTENDLYEHKLEGQCRHNVLIHSQASFEQHLISIEDQIRKQDIIMDLQTRRIKRAAEMNDNNGAIAEHEDAQNILKKAEGKKKALPTFHQELLTHWATDDIRVLGHIIFSPPIAVGASHEGYTQDVAVIDIHPARIDRSSFAGNVIDLGNKYSLSALTIMMNTGSRDFHSIMDLDYRLLGLRGTFTDDEMRKPTTYDQKTDSCTMVMKRGLSTGLTVGRANNVFSYTRNYFGDDSGISKQSGSSNHPSLGWSRSSISKNRAMFKYQIPKMICFMRHTQSSAEIPD